jgi:uncharacterized protein (DUF1697 family)
LARYAAFLRGVMPTNAKMPELKRAFEDAGFAEVRTVLGSGNLAFTARAATTGALERRAEAAMARCLGRTFLTFVRPADALQALIAEDPYRAFRLPAGAKRIVTFLRRAPAPDPRLPIAIDGARLHARRGLEVFGSYAPGSPDFMTLIERTFGKDVTTRTWDTVAKVVR